jgi:hypothetical protein
LYQAAQGSISVFGSMGSWNDTVGASAGESSVLYRASQVAFRVAVNSSAI